MREELAIESDTSLPSEWVLRVLEEVVAWHSGQQTIHLDNELDLIAERLMSWCAEQGQASGGTSNWENRNRPAFIEQVGHLYRTGVLKAYVFELSYWFRFWKSAEDNERVTMKNDPMRQERVCRRPRIEPNS